MSHFYATASGQARTTATRRGSKVSGVTTQANVWDHGITVTLTHDPVTSADTITVLRTGGSNNDISPITLYQETIPC